MRQLCQILFKQSWKGFFVLWQRSVILWLILLIKHRIKCHAGRIGAIHPVTFPQNKSWQSWYPVRVLKQVMKWSAGFGVIPEHLWCTPPELEQVRAQEWQNISQAFLVCLVRSMKRRCQPCTDARGGHMPFAFCGLLFLGVIRCMPWSAQCSVWLFTFP